MVCCGQGRLAVRTGRSTGQQKSGRPAALIRAARDFPVERPEFALVAGMTGLRGIANGYGYDITGIDVLDAYAAVLQAAGAAGMDVNAVKADVRALVVASRGGGEFVGRVLGRQLAE